MLGRAVIVSLLVGAVAGAWVWDTYQTALTVDATTRAMRELQAAQDEVTALRSKVSELQRSAANEPVTHTDALPASRVDRLRQIDN